MKNRISGKEGRSERSVLLVLAAVSFIYHLDFMMVLPLGPDFAAALGIPLSRLGIVGGAYTAAATVIGIIGSMLLDRYERRFLLTFSAAGLGLATMAGAVTYGLKSFVAARIAAGIFGGVASTMCFSVMTDLVPEARRGAATALVAAGFSLASIFGLPISLELARLGGWRMPFVFVGLLALLLAGLARLSLPLMEDHLDSKKVRAPLALDARAALAFLAFGCATANFLLVPNLSAYLQYNMGLPRERLGSLYLAGGLASLVTMRVAGVWTDRARPFWPVLMTTVLLSAALAAGALIEPPLLSPVLFFTVFMACSAARWVAINAISSRVPAPAARARYLSAQNTVLNAACALAALGSTAFLSVGPSGRLVGMPGLAAAAVILGLCVPVVIWKLEALVLHSKPSIGAVVVPGPEL